MVARGDECRQGLAALNGSTEFQGVLLTGASGVGKSTLARSLAAAVEERGHPVRFVLGTETGRTVPLGAFSRAVTMDAVPEPATMLAAAHTMLGSEPNLVVVVDDVQLLDPLSALLVHQCATGGSARLILTLGPADAIPDVVTALVKERRLRCVHIEAFTVDQTAELVGAVLGGCVDHRLIDELHSRTGGNPLFLRGLLSAGHDSGVLVESDGGWRLGGALRPDRELDDLLEFRLRSLAPAELEVVQILAVAELLDWQVLRDLCDVSAVTRLEQHGLIQLVADGPDTVARLNNPVIGDVALRLAGVVQTRQLNGVLARALGSYLLQGGRRTRLPDLRGRIQLAQFMMHSDLPPDPDVITAAAMGALAISNLGHAEELARFGRDHGGGLRSVLILAESLSWQGRGDEAEAVLVEAEPEGPDELVRWGCSRAANLFWGCGQVESARARLAEIAPRVESSELADLVAAMEVSFAFFSADIGSVVERGLSLCAVEARRPTAVWATMAMSTAWALGLVGRFAEVRGVAQAARPATAVGWAGMQLLAVGLAEVTGLTAAGNLPEADAVVRRYARLSTGAPGGDAVIDAIRGQVQLARGEVAAARAALQNSVAVLAAEFPAGWLMVVATWAAQAEGAGGRAAAAGTALRTAERAYGPQMAVFAPELQLARAWECACVGETTAAQTHALAAARQARRAGMTAVELRALHTAVRFGDRTHAARLAELAALLDTPLAAAMACHAHGLAHRDGDELDAAADRFADLGAMALAADAAAQAAREHTQAGRRDKALGSASRAHAVADRCGLCSPAVVAAARPLPITDREREIAALVAAGLSNRQIADRLVVSVRTVDGHLYRMFAKLGIAHRDQLIGLVADRSAE